MPWIPIAATAIVLASVLCPLSPLVNGETGAPAIGARLVIPDGGVALAPFWGLLDAMSLLTVPQHIAMLVWLAVPGLVLAVRPTRAEWRLPTRLALAASGPAALFVLYVLGALLARPMARLALDDPAELAVDFHSHTDASHDGRGGFTLADARDWHVQAGFAAFYVTEHQLASAWTAMPDDNAMTAGEAVVALPGSEFPEVRAHVVRLMTSSPLLIETLPVDLVRKRTGESALAAIELSDASPRGLEQSRHDRSSILHLADSLDLALVTGSNNHGWGRTAAAWSVMRLPGWRALSPAMLGASIERTLAVERRHASRVIERRPLVAGASPLELLVIVPGTVWGMLRTESAPERLSTIGWIWILSAIPGIRRQRTAVPRRYRIRRVGARLAPRAPSPALPAALSTVSTEAGG